MSDKRPNMARGARSQANLKRTAGPGRPKKTGAEKANEAEVRKIARKLLDPAYIKQLKERLVTGKIQPGVEVAIWQYAYGKPKEEIDIKQQLPVRIVHEYSDEETKK